MGEIDTLAEQIAALEVRMGAAAGVTAAFDAEIARMGETLVFTGREVNTLSAGLAGGLRRAFDGVVFDGMRLSDALKQVAQTMASPSACTSLYPTREALRCRPSASTAGS